MDESRINTLYELPVDLECAPPFGAECLQVFAGSTKMGPVLTRKVDGYDILVEDLDRFLSGVRGLKRAGPHSMMTEARLEFTTMEETTNR